MAISATRGPDTPSSDYTAMKPYWDMTATILAGATAMRAAGETYLPKFEAESENNYELRRVNAKFTNLYGDIVEGLAAKPFSEPVTLEDGSASAPVKALAEDIDGRGNNLHVFAADVMFSGINNGVDYILVDYSKARPRADGRPLSKADETKQGLRPYWVHIPATRMLAVYTAVVQGVEVFVHARIQESITRREGFDEVFVERIRVLNREPIYEVIDGVQTEEIVDYGPATFQVYEKTTTGTRIKRTAWQVVASGFVTIGVIPLVRYLTGKRIEGSARVIPPMQAAADLQVEHYQAENAHKNLRTLTAFPMLTGNGVSPPTDGANLVVGPNTILYAPPVGENGQHGEWNWMKGDAPMLKEHRDGVEAIEDQLREIGRQPLSTKAGVTVVMAAAANQKASAALQAWALGLKDALEQAMRLTCQWLGDASAPVVNVFSDFALDGADDKGPDFLLSMRKNGDLTRRSLWSEARRRNILAPDFDADAEDEGLLEEEPGDDTDKDLEGALPPANDREAA